MQFFDAGSLDGKELTFYKTVHGSGDRLRARARPPRGAVDASGPATARTCKDLLFYHDLAHGQVHNIHQFFHAAYLTPQTFNSFYMDDKNIGVFTSGLIPIRPSNVDPGLPIDGRGKEEWHGTVSFKNHPQGINPPSGEIVNWNNRPEAGYEAPDDNWSLGADAAGRPAARQPRHGNHLTRRGSSAR